MLVEADPVRQHEHRVTAGRDLDVLGGGDQQIRRDLRELGPGERTAAQAPQQIEDAVVESGRRVVGEHDGDPRIVMHELGHDFQYPYE
ncbi:hypothetical protein ACGFRB_11960 [Streptomyces sp. NPDC048718]|uniref:hypothetical protein n=1 Tax=Streptomyces sp. NPDC048718 TaxID=3365587 RepID=UPI00371D99AF